MKKKRKAAKPSEAQLAAREKFKEMVKKNTMNKAKASLERTKNK